MNNNSLLGSGNLTLGSSASTISVLARDFSNYDYNTIRNYILDVSGSSPTIMISGHTENISVSNIAGAMFPIRALTNSGYLFSNSGGQFLRFDFSTNNTNGARSNIGINAFAFAGLGYDPNSNTIVFGLDNQVNTGGTYFSYNLNRNISESISYPGATGDYKWFRKPCLDPVNGIFFFSPGYATNVYYFTISNRTMNAIGPVPNTTSGGAEYFASSVYSPTNRRIYLIPFGYSNRNTWYYINCDNRTLVSYSNGNLNLVQYAFFGGVYSPTENRIYLIPYNITSSTWYFINCTTGNVEGFTGPSSGLSSRYYGGIFIPTENKIFLVPSNQSNQTTWHYIDCSNGSVVGYSAPFSSISDKYTGALFDPDRNRLTFVGQTSNSNSNEQWAFIQFGKKTIDPVLCAYFAQCS